MEKSPIPTARLEALHSALDRIRVAPAYQSGKWFVGPLNFAPEVQRAMRTPRAGMVPERRIRQIN